MSQTQRAPSGRADHALDGSAPSALEYAILALLIASIAVGTWKTLGEPLPLEEPAPSEQQ